MNVASVASQEPAEVGRRHTAWRREAAAMRSRTFDRRSTWCPECNGRRYDGTSHDLFEPRARPA